MKKLPIISFVAMFVIAGFTATSQTQTGSILVPPEEKTLPDTTMKDYVSMQGGQMIIVQDKKTKKMDKEMTMSDGTVVKTDGTVITKDGKKIELREGDRVYMNGKIDIQVKPNVG